MSNEIRILSAVTGAPVTTLRLDDDSQNIVSPVTGRKIGTVDPNTPIPGGADVSGVTATAGDVDASKKFVTADGTLTDGTLAAAVQPAPTVSVNSSTGLVTASYTPVAGRVKDTSAKSGTLQLTAKAAATYTPGTTDQTISAERYLTGAQTVKGDANLVAANIKNGVTIFGVTGSHQGGGGGFPLALVDAYTPAYEAINSFTLSGLTDHTEEGGDDLTGGNGTYPVTSSTASLPASQRVYKHATASFYVYYLEANEDAGVYAPGWGLFSSLGQTDFFSALLYTPATELAAGSSTWSSEMGMNSDTVTISNINSTHHDPAVVVREVTAYNATTGLYTFGSTPETLTSYETEPVPHYIYMKSGTGLVGRAVGNEGGNNLLTYITGHEAEPVVKYGNPRNTSYMYGLTAWSFPVGWVDGSLVSQFSTVTLDGMTCLYNPNSTAQNLCDPVGSSDTVTGGRIAPVPSTTNRHWAFLLAFHYGSQTSKKQRLVNITIDNTGGPVCLDVDWTAATPYLLLTRNGTEIARHTPSGLTSGWHHAALVYDIDAQELKLYYDGTAVGTVSALLLERKGYYDAFRICLGDFDGNYCIGHVAEIKLYAATLTAAQVAAEFGRVAALWGA